VSKFLLPNLSLVSIYLRLRGSEKACWSEFLLPDLSLVSVYDCEGQKRIGGADLCSSSPFKSFSSRECAVIVRIKGGNFVWSVL
jgi:hypothetical protein